MTLSDTYLTDDYLWLVVIGALASFSAAFGIGANDVANCTYSERLFALAFPSILCPAPRLDPHTLDRPTSSPCFLTHATTYTRT